MTDGSNTDSNDGMDMMMMMMPMYFWTGTDLTWLINGWDSTTGGSYFAGLLVTFILGFTIEALTFCRNYLYVKSQTRAIERTIELNRYVSPERAMQFTRIVVPSPLSDQD